MNKKVPAKGHANKRNRYDRKQRKLLVVVINREYLALKGGANFCLLDYFGLCRPNSHSCYNTSHRLFDEE